MKIVDSAKEGLSRSLKSWKGILIIWLICLIFISLIVFPLKASVLSSFGNSTITDKLKDGFNSEVFNELGTTYNILGSFFSSGMILVLVLMFFVNSFITGGLFYGLRDVKGGFTFSEFFRASSKNFLSFLVISAFILLIIVLLSVLFIVIPVSVGVNSTAAPDVVAVHYGIIGSSIFLFFLIILLIVADYARAWQAANEQNNALKALGFGFRRAYKSFYSSYPLMIGLLVVQIIYGWIAYSVIDSIKSGSGTGVLFLFLVSQILFIFRLYLKTWRYGSMTRMMELS